MEKDFSFKRRPSGTEKKNEPKVIGRVLIEYLHSNEPLAVAFRKWKARDKDAKTKEGDEPGRLFEDIYPHTELDVDLKLFTLKPGRVNEGEFLAGMLTRDGEDHFSFVENASERKKVVTRNPHLYKGKYVNVNQTDDGRRYPTFCRPAYTDDFTLKHFCLLAAEELLMIAGLIEK